jgi:2-polyprenyl-3-methyl-5-hydroxy-6-metoxy-1,4-benzoquinol methylase
MVVDRDCPICNSSQKEKLYRQKFSAISDGSLFNGYDIVVCKNCGFGFADDIPDQAEFDRYYKRMSKYENEHQDGQVSESTLGTYQAIVQSVKAYLPNLQARIIDVGCATGGLLSLFKHQGYSNVIGVDPSPSCAKSAQRLYGIHVYNCAVSDIPEFEAPFDFVLLNSVLEHIRDVKSSLATMRDLLTPDGLIWIEVPDVSRFANLVSAAFQQFSMEHINFFSAATLTNLMGINGFELVALWHNERQLEATLDPALSTIFRKSEKLYSISPDTSTSPALVDYVERSIQVDGDVLEKIEIIANSGRPVVVWGVGTHTQRLLATSKLAQANIIAFIDSNARYQDKFLDGKPILTPDLLKTISAPIIISSRLYQEEIAEQIQKLLNLPNEIIRLY